MKDFKTINKTINMFNSTPDKDLNFVVLDLDSLCMAFFVVAKFGANLEAFSQLEFSITFMDKHANVYIIHYGSLKSKPITGSALAPDLFANVHGVDISSTIRLSINNMVNKVIPMHF